MDKIISLTLARSEQQLVLRLLCNFKAEQSAQINDLIRKITDGEKQPNITIGVYGGQVQWVLGNPFPIRICDYDGEKEELPDIDERGQHCRIWVEATDASLI